MEYDSSYVHIVHMRLLMLSKQHNEESNVHAESYLYSISVPKMNPKLPYKHYSFNIIFHTILA